VRVALEPPPGLISDDTTFAAEGAWADGNNMRFVAGRPQTIRGWGTLVNDMATGVCRNALAWTEQNAGMNIALGTHSALQVYVSGALATITPAGLAAGSIDASGGTGGWSTGSWGSSSWSTPDAIYYPRTWSLATWGEKLLAVPRGGTLYQWSNDPTVVAAAIANAPSQITAMLVTPQRQVLAIGCVPTGDVSLNPLCVRGCAIEDNTTWTPLSTNTAFEDKLEGGGRLLTGRMVGDYVALWSDNALYMGEYTGNTAGLYRWQMVETNCGIVGQNAVAVYKGRAVWIAPDGQFRAWAPGQDVQIVECPIRNDFFDHADVSQISKVIATTISQHDEIWWFYPDSRDTADGSVGEQSRYLALNVSGDQPIWFRGQMGRTAFVDAGVQTYPMGVAYDGTIYRHEYGTTADWRIKTADQYLDSAEQLLLLKGIWPDFEDQQGSVSLTVYVREYPQGAQVTKGPYTLSTSTRKKDFRAQGRIAALEFTGSAFARLGKPTFETTITGRR
jgi:hypothetical protein